MSYIWVQSARIWICLQDQDIPTSWGTAELFIQQSCEVHMHCKLGNVFPPLVLSSAVTVDCISTKNCRQLQFFFKWKSSLHERFPFMLIIYFLSVPHLVGIPWSENVAVQFSEREFYLHSVPTGLTSLSFLSTLKYLVEWCFWFAGSGALRGLWAQWDPELGKKKRKLLFSNFPCFKSVIEPSKF